MQGVKKFARSGSLIVEELFGNKHKRNDVDPAEIEYENGFNGSFFSLKICCQFIQEVQGFIGRS